MAQKQHRIRASMLPAWPDCPRRSAAKSFKYLVKAKGYALRELPPSIGAAVGTAVHKVAEVVLQHKIDTGEVGSQADGFEQALVGFREEIAPGAVWDDTTPNVNAAEHQINSLAKAYMQVAETVMPKAVELSLEANAGDGFLLTGHIDLLTADEYVRDLKTGAVDRPYYQQHGAYALLVRSNQISGIQGLAVDWLKRVGKTKAQPPVVIKEYSVDACQRAALEVIGDVKRCVQDFEKTGSAVAFSANCMSMMCNDKYCPAWGTAFCPVSMAGKGEKL